MPQKRRKKVGPQNEQEKRMASEVPPLSLQPGETQDTQDVIAFVEEQGRYGTIYAHPDALTSRQAEASRLIRDDIAAIDMMPGDAPLSVQSSAKSSNSTSVGSTPKYVANWDSVFGNTDSRYN